MTRILSSRAIGSISAALALALVLWCQADAMVGNAPVLPRNCSFTHVTAELGPDGSIRYNITGTCNGAPITGQLAYATNQQMSERFFYSGAELRTTAMCPADPWVTGAPCQNPLVSAKGADPGALIHAPVPLSRSVVNAGQAFQTARANAALPKPPGPPVNMKATRRSQNTATLSWLGPDQQDNFGPYLNFIVEARPQNAEGAAWTRLGGLPRHAALDYQLTVKLPPPVPGTEGWELRTCSTTALTSTCTSPVIPALTPLTERDLRMGKNKIENAPPVNSGISPMLQSPAIDAAASANPSSKTNAPVNPLSSQSTPIPGLTQPAPSGQSTALPPQPLPPKALSKPALAPKALSGGIMRRGVEQEDSTPTDSKPAP